MIALLCSLLPRGPVMGITFGSRVSDWELTRFSLRNELFSLLVSIFIGAFVSLIASWFFVREWPTDEMKSRGGKYLDKWDIELKLPRPNFLITYSRSTLPWITDSQSFLLFIFILPSVFAIRCIWAYCRSCYCYP